MNNFNLKIEDSLQDKLSKYLDLQKEIRELENKSIDILNNLLNFVFPVGKYKGKSIFDVISIDYSYVEWWINQNTTPSYDSFRIAFNLKSIKDIRIAFEQHKREEEYEEIRMTYCKRNGIDYNLDYEIRHNRNLRDFGM